MGILKMDKMGRLYESNGDRSDGGGFSRYAAPVEQTDLTLGSVYLKAEQQRKFDNIKASRVREIEKLQSAMELSKLKAVKAVKAKKHANDMAMHRNQDYQDYMVKKGLGCDCDGDNTVAGSGYGLSANGQKGVDGMTRDQQVIAKIGMGYGKDPLPVDPMESYQHQLKAQAKSMIYDSAMREAKRNQIEADQARLEQDIRSGKIRKKVPVTAKYTSGVVYQHPMLTSNYWKVRS